MSIRIALYGRAYEERHYALFNKLLDQLYLIGAQLYVYDDLYVMMRDKFVFSNAPTIFNTQQDLIGQVDYMLSIGGDGTLLNTVTLIGNSGIPVLGINTGRLGFLSSVSSDEISQAVHALGSGHVQTESRSLIKVETANQLFGNENFALNEVCVHRKDTSSMISVHAFVDKHFLNTYWADGLIVATPTGSTAYSLSCGGPIIAPDAQVFILTPVSTHNLTVRPIVIPDSSTIRIKAEGREEKFLLSLDSRSETIESSIELTISKMNYNFHLIKLPGMNFFSTIREKLMWGMDKRN